MDNADCCLGVYGGGVEWVEVGGSWGGCRVEEEVEGGTLDGGEVGGVGGSGEGVGCGGEFLGVDDGLAGGGAEEGEVAFLGVSRRCEEGLKVVKC